MNVIKKGKIETFVDKVPHWILLINSICLFLIIWKCISMTERGGFVFASPEAIFKELVKEASKPLVWKHVSISLFRVISGFLLAFVCAVPVALLMGWYKSIRSVFEPWVQFIRCIPPIAYLPLVIVACGVGESSKVTNGLIQEKLGLTDYSEMIETLYQKLGTGATDYINQLSENDLRNLALYKTYKGRLIKNQLN